MTEDGLLAGLTRRILGCAIEVHRHLGPGLLESTYRACLMAELAAQGLSARCEIPVSIRYRGNEIAAAYRADIVIEESVLVELKAVDELNASHIAQVLTYLRNSEFAVGLLINFNEPTLMRGVKRFLRGDRPQGHNPTHDPSH
jgi:GxxExxY protein